MAIKLEIIEGLDLVALGQGGVKSW